MNKTELIQELQGVLYKLQLKYNDIPQTVNHRRKRLEITADIAGIRNAIQIIHGL